jgi:hypothetical protein
MTGEGNAWLKLGRRLLWPWLFFLLCLPLMGQVNAAGEYAVITTLDSGPGTLRWAIEQANSHPGPDVIRFDLNLTGRTILLTSELPPLTDDGTTIDASPNWIGSWPWGEPGIGLRREEMTPEFAGLVIRGADNCTVKGLRIEHFEPGILILDGATGNTIGGGSPGSRILVRDCTTAAIMISFSDRNRVLGCYIGTNEAGNQPEPNSGTGVYISGSQNQIGGTGPREGNIIGASFYGLMIGDSSAVSNTVQANWIGTGMLNEDLGNQKSGILIIDGASYNQIGGASPETGNHISRNGESGVEMISEVTQYRVSMESNTIAWNSITRNHDHGIEISDTSNGLVSIRNLNINSNYIADNGLNGIITNEDQSSFQSNTIVRNGQSGVYIDGGDQNDFYSNFIGTDEAGTAGLGNGHHGVGLYNGATYNGVSANVIAQNNWSGVAIVNSSTIRNSVVNNYIGVTKNGQPLGNGYYGVGVVESWNNTLWQNVIAHNGTSGSRAGVRIEGATATSNFLWQNSIYSNTGAGIELLNGGNNELAAPAISQVDCPYVTGSGAPAHGLVQLFSDNADEGRVYEGQTSANSSGQWVYYGSFRGPYLTVIATDSELNTSRFSAPVAAGGCSVIYLPLIMRQ